MMVYIGNRLVASDCRTAVRFGDMEKNEENADKLAKKILTFVIMEDTFDKMRFNWCA